MSEGTRRVAVEETAAQKAKADGAGTAAVTASAAKAEAVKTYTARAYAAGNATSGLAPVSIRRREPGAQDVQIAILYCGVCHSDLHQVRNEWQNALPTVYPWVQIPSLTPTTY